MWDYEFSKQQWAQRPQLLGEENDPKKKTVVELEQEEKMAADLERLTSPGPLTDEEFSSLLDNMFDDDTDKHWAKRTELPNDTRFDLPKPNRNKP